jgi:hypothetical protein
MGRVSSERRGVLTDRLLGGAEFSHAYWFFGNLYEALVKIPNRVASAEESPEFSRSPFGAGSPGRYYAPIAPLNFPLAAAASAVGGAATAYLLRSINPDLFFSPQPLSEMRRKALLNRWYRVHAVRLAASAVALAAVDHARTARPETLAEGVAGGSAAIREAR